MHLLAETTDPTSILLNNGILGVIVVAAIPVVRGLFKREQDRGDRLEGELREQTRLIQERYVADLTRANEAIARALDSQR